MVPKESQWPAAFVRFFVCKNVLLFIYENKRSVAKNRRSSSHLDFTSPSVTTVLRLLYCCYESIFLFPFWEILKQFTKHVTVINRIQMDQHVLSYNTQMSTSVLEVLAVFSLKGPYFNTRCEWD